MTSAPAPAAPPAESVGDEQAGAAAPLPADRLIKVCDLRVHFPAEDGPVRAVDGVSWHIGRGETLALVGESGSGKSVSAMALLRLTDMSGGRIVSGRVLFQRQSGGPCIDIVRQSERALRDIRGNDISMIFQEPMTSLNPVFTVGDQIAEAVMLHQDATKREARGRALEMLKLVRMPEAERQLDSYPHQLSGGMRQRAMIAMALSCRPALLIADEPTTALDVTIQAQILDLIKLLQREIGMSVLFITHDMGVVAEVADRVVVMLRGRKVEEGPVEEIFHRPRHPYTRALLDAVPRLGSMAGRPSPVKFPNVDIRRSEGEEVADPRDEDEAALEVPSTVREGEPPVLVVRGLTTRFDLGGGFLRRPRGRIHAVENVSFELKAGETLALVGESGCGKSTTGRTILRLVEPTRGSIRFRGEEIVGRDRDAMRPFRRHMQMIFQDPFASLNPRMTAGWLIAEPLKIHGIASGGELKERVVDLLRRVGLDAEHAERYPHEFSGGQRQRVCIATALALNPSLIIADEAVSALDVSIRAQIINLMMDLQVEFGLAYLFISHDLAVVERISHRVAVMYLGEIVEIGPRAAVFEDPRHPYTRKLMAAVPVADPTLRRTELRLMTDEIPSPLRPPGYEPEPRALEEVSPGHFVMPR